MGCGARRLMSQITNALERIPNDTSAHETVEKVGLDGMAAGTGYQYPLRSRSQGSCDSPSTVVCMEHRYGT
jgi:hypothetical protein